MLSPAGTLVRRDMRDDIDADWRERNSVEVPLAEEILSQGHARSTAAETV